MLELTFCLTSVPSKKAKNAGTEVLRNFASVKKGQKCWNRGILFVRKQIYTSYGSAQAGSFVNRPICFLSSGRLSVYLHDKDSLHSHSQDETEEKKTQVRGDIRCLLVRTTGPAG